MNKKNIFVILLILSLGIALGLTACSGNNSNGNEGQNDTKNVDEPMDTDDNKDTKSNLIPETDINWDKGSEVSLTGLVEYGMEGHITIVANWKSKSRVSYYIYGDLQKELEQNEGMIATVSGTVMNKDEQPSPWTSYMLVDEITEIVDEKTYLNREKEEKE